MNRIIPLLFLSLAITLNSCNSRDHSDIITKLLPLDELAGTKGTDQTLKEYMVAKTVSLDSNQNIIYLAFLDIDSSDQRTLTQELTPYLAVFFQLNVKTITLTDPLPEAAYSHNPVKRKQLKLKFLFDHYLATQRPQDAAIVIAITSDPLVPKGKTYSTMGEGDITKGNAIFSLDKLKGDKEYVLRIKKMATKVACQSLGITTSYRYRSLLNRTKNGTQLDDSPLHLSAIDLEKLQHKLQFDVGVRFNALTSYWSKHDQKQATFYDKRSAAWAE